MFIVYVKEINRVHHIHSQMIKINNIKSKKNKKKNNTFSLIQLLLFETIQIKTVCCAIL